MKSIDRQRIVSLLVTLGLHALALGVLMLIHISSTPLRTELVELVLINYGTTSEMTQGQEEPARGNVQEKETPMPPSASKNTSPKSHRRARVKQPPINTMTRNEAPKIDAAEVERRRAAEEAERRRREARQEAIRAQQAEEARKRAERQIGQDVAGAFGRGRNKSESQGADVKGTGNQGSIHGSGDSYALSGRTIAGNGGQPVRPTYASAIRGTIRVGIEVDASGGVVNAWIDPAGTNIADAGMRSSARDAARRTRFNAVSNAPNQRGTITYRYDLR
ncbi:energy transducer TonB family protein [Porphyromonas crevioricanis]|uniref:energy transducer TonB family protein n=1 Tax=Porphyromonas crevioricanis TaxID=393921 RepID=UPI00068A879A|nr:energy transducer TonB [Porphyromonas crevioricanis]